MSTYQVHNIESAPEVSKPAMQELKKAFGFVPNLVGAMAASPVLISSMAPVFHNVHSGSFSEAEVQVVLLTDPVTNSAAWPVALHSKLALDAGVSADDVQAIRARRAPKDRKLAAMSALARTIIEKRGHLEDRDLAAFQEAGYGSRSSLHPRSPTTRPASPTRRWKMRSSRTPGARKLLQRNCWLTEAPMTTNRIEIATPDGPCTTEVVTPKGSGPRPAVIVFYDAGGLRPAQTRIAERISEGGYVVVQPDLFHRSPPLSALLGNGPITLAAFAKVFQDPVLRGRFMADYYLPALAYENLTKTIGAVLDEIAKWPHVKGPVGTTGYCMGGNASVRTATLFGDRIGATAAFHPGGLVTDQPDSPHTRVKTIKSRVYLGPAVGDLPPEAEAKLRAAFDAGHVRYEIEQYEAKHGYAVDDSEVYDRTAAERHYSALDKLFRETLHV